MKRPRDFRIEGDYAFVPLTKGFEAKIDAADIDLVSGFCWHAHQNTTALIYARRTVRKGEATSVVLMHREIIGAPNNILVDHKDGNGLNNTRANLRTASPLMNNRNAGLRSDSSSGLKGVTFEARAKKWGARIRVNGKLHFLGYFGNPEDAHAAYCDAARKHFGEFARFS